MKYYRVEKDNVFLNQAPWQLIKGELFTEKELQRYKLNPQNKCFVNVEIPKSMVYWTFGRRRQRTGLESLCHDER